jgi:flagellin-like hook-associated protein FlgL
MTSILTNSSAMAALSTLRSISSDMESTQGRISSGLRVGDASDNAAYWSIATTMRSDNKALSTVQDALGLGAAKTDTAYTGLNAAIDVVSEIKAKLKNQLVSTATSASFSGENWLYRDAGSAAALGTKEMVGSFTRGANGSVAVGVLEFDAATSVLIDTVDSANGQLTKALSVEQGTAVGTGTANATYHLVLASGGTAPTGSVLIALAAATPDADVEGMISAVDAMLTNLTDAAATLGATNTRISMQDEFMADLMDVIDKGVGRLVDADMNEESTRLKALQTQQQLGIQALSIANSDSQNILSLFR